MPKTDAPPLLPRGAQRLDVSDLHRLTVLNFPESERRPKLFSDLQKLVDELDSSGTLCELWVDGSFLTEKLEPEDIDLSLIIDFDVVGSIEPRVVQMLLTLQSKAHPLSGSLDFYIADQKDNQSLEYWDQFWSRGRDNSPKGYAVLMIGPPNV